MIHCYEEADWPEFECGCERLNVTSVGRVTEYSPDRLGTYVRLPDQYKEGYLAPVYAKATLKHDVSDRFLRR